MPGFINLSSHVSNILNILFAAQSKSWCGSIKWNKNKWINKCNQWKYYHFREIVKACLKVQTDLNPHLRHILPGKRISIL